MVIGVTPLYDEERNSYWMVPGYLKMLESEQAIPFILPLTNARRELDYFLNICDGFLLTGGHDVSPELYNAPQRKECGALCRERDEMERCILRECVERDKPVLGICRGIQLMNACFGGSLYQDLPTEYHSEVEHHMNPPYNRIAHYVRIKEGSMLHDIMGTDRIGVNSYHHQAIRELSPMFEEMAVSEDGLTEAIYMPEKTFVVGVQWHPEFFYEDDIYSQRLVEAFVKAGSTA